MYRCACIQARSTRCWAENGAGKSTLVKCIMGFYRADSGDVSVDGKGRDIASPRDAHGLGLGMVYQHFTLVPNMTVAENLVLARAHLPNVIDWKTERERLGRVPEPDAAEGAAGFPMSPRSRQARSRRWRFSSRFICSAAS